jgi:two-component system cell cycle response regulator DivK
MSLEKSISDRPVLLIDDNPQNLRLAGFLLKSAGFRVQGAGSAEEALDLLETERFSLILVDIQLPGMDGLELTRRIRATPRWADLTVVALTACAMLGDEERMIAAGCDAYIGKPIESRTFAGQVSRYMDPNAAGQEVEPDALANLERSRKPEVLLRPEVLVKELLLLKNEFLTETRREARALLSMPDIDLGEEPTFRALHRWAGVGRSIGLAPVTDLAREAECHAHQPHTIRGPLVRPLIASILTFLESGAN